MKKSIITAILLIVSVIAFSQTKPAPAKSAPVKQYTVQLNETELTQLFQLINLAKALAPYGKQKSDEKINTIQFIDEYSEKLGAKVKEIALPDSTKKK